MSKTNPLLQTLRQHRDVIDDLAGLMAETLADVRHLYPMDVEKFLASDRSTVKAFFLLSKFFELLCVTIGERLARSYTEYENLSTQGLSRRDVLDFMEKGGLIPSANEFLDYYLKLRNKLAHEYLDNLQKQVELLNYLLVACEGLHRIAEKTVAVLDENYGGKE